MTTQEFTINVPKKASSDRRNAVRKQALRNIQLIILTWFRNLPTTIRKGVLEFIAATFIMCVIIGVFLLGFGVLLTIADFFMDAAAPFMV